MLDPRRLRMLIEVDRAGSFAQAAAALDYTPGAVWQQIRALELDVGRPLVVRQRTGATLTAAGSALVEASRPVLSSLRDAELQVAAWRRQAGGSARIAASTDAASAVVAAAFARVSAENGGIEVELIEGTPAQCTRAAANGEADVAVVCARDEQLDCTPPLELVCEEVEPRIVIFPEGHRVAALERVDIPSLAAVTPVLGGSDDGDRPAVICPRGSAIALLALVQRGLGVAVLPGLATTVLPAGVDWRPLDEGPLRRLVVAATPAARKQPSVGTLVDALAAEVRAHAHRWESGSDRAAIPAA